MKIRHIDFLKENIEGSEYEMIDGMHDSIGKVKNTAIFCHDFLFENNNRILNKVLDSWIYGVN